jgi:hypothetical protein
LSEDLARLREPEHAEGLDGGGAQVPVGVEGARVELGGELGAVAAEAGGAGGGDVDLGVLVLEAEAQAVDACGASA